MARNVVPMRKGDAGCNNDVAETDSRFDGTEIELETSGEVVAFAPRHEERLAEPYLPGDERWDEIIWVKKAS